MSPIIPLWLLKNLLSERRCACGVQRDGRQSFDAKGGEGGHRSKPGLVKSIINVRDISMMYIHVYISFIVP